HGGAVVAFEGLFVMLSRGDRFLPMFLSAAVTAIAFAPWAVRVVAEARAIGGLAPNLGWMQRPDVRDVAAYFASLHGPYRSGLRLDPALVLAGFVIFGVPLLLLLLSAIRRVPEEDRPGASPDTVRWLAFFAFGRVPSPLPAGRCLPLPVFEARHMLIAVVPYSLLCAAAALALRPRVLRALAAALMVAWAWIGGVKRLPDRDAVSWGTLVGRM